MNFTPQNYPDQLKNLKMNENYARRMITAFDYPGFNTKHDLTENGMILPTFMPEMLKFTLNHNYLPTPGEFLRSYFDTYPNIVNDNVVKKYATMQNAINMKAYYMKGPSVSMKRKQAKDWIDANGIDLEEYIRKEIIHGISGRIRRSVPSLYRDIHAYIQLKDMLPNHTVYYNQDMDLINDVDSLIEVNGEYYALCLYTNTKNAQDYRVKKENRHTRFDNVKYIEAELPLTDEYANGYFYLYNRKILSEILTNNIPGIQIS